MSAMLDTADGHLGGGGRRHAALRASALELAEVVRDAVNLYADVAEDKGVGLESRAAPGVCVSADRNRMRQVVANLLDNAIKYTPAGGRVEVQTARDGAEAVLTVRDTGRRHSRRRSCRGSGSGSTGATRAGPSAAWAWASAWSRPSWRPTAGEWRPTSVPGQGSTFIVRLPSC